jgi:hypothetical protein
VKIIHSENAYKNLIITKSYDLLVSIESECVSHNSNPAGNPVDVLMEVMCGLKSPQDNPPPCASGK